MKFNQFMLIGTRGRTLESQNNYLIAKHDFLEKRIDLDVALGKIQSN